MVARLFKILIIWLTHHLIANSAKKKKLVNCPTLLKRV